MAIFSMWLGDPEVLNHQEVSNRCKALGIQKVRVGTGGWHSNGIAGHPLSNDYYKNMIKIYHDNLIEVAASNYGGSLMGEPELMDLTNEQTLTNVRNSIVNFLNEVPFDEHTDDLEEYLGGGEGYLNFAYTVRDACFSVGRLPSLYYMMHNYPSGTAQDAYVTPKLEGFSLVIARYSYEDYYEPQLLENMLKIPSPIGVQLRAQEGTIPENIKDGFNYYDVKAHNKIMEFTIWAYSIMKDRDWADLASIMPNPNPATNTILPDPRPNNLLSLEDGRWHSDVGWGLLPANNEGVWLDDTVTVNFKPTFKIMGGGNGSGNTGADHEWFTIKPLDHINFSCYIRTGAPTIPRSMETWCAGARIGIDIGDANGLHGGGSFGISDPMGRGVTTEASNTFVKFNNPKWTKKTIDFVVQEEYISNQINTNKFIPDFLIPWFQVHSCMDALNETGIGWFAQPELYINEQLQPTNGCFIATAAEMTPQQLDKLRRIRDAFKTFPAGKNLVDFYYKKAFKYVPLVKQNPELKKDIHDALELLLKVYLGYI